jgi:hypothetical protein
MVLDSIVSNKGHTSDSSLFSPTSIEDPELDDNCGVEMFHNELDSLISTLETPIDPELDVISEKEFSYDEKKSLINDVSKPDFVPYEIRLEDLAEVSKRTILGTKQIAFENGVLMRWSGDNGPQVYLIQSEDQEQSFQINGEKTYANAFDGYVDHNFEDNQSILFENRKYPYNVSSDDITDLSKRMKVQTELVADRIHNIGKISSDETGEIIVPCRDTEIEILYTKSTTKKVPPKRKNGRIRNTKDIIVLQAENELHGDDITEEDYARLEEERPKTYGECQNNPDPCVFVGCQYNLYLDVKKKGHIKFNFPETDVVDLRQTCALREAEKGGMTLGAIEERLMITREGVRRIEERALNKMRLRSIHLIDLHHSTPVIYRTRNSHDF